MENKDLEPGDKESVENVENATQCLLNQIQGQHDGTNPSSPLICKAPNALRVLSPNSFLPRVVSIGPLHYSDFYSGRGEKKQNYLNDLMCRIPFSKDETLKSCVQNVYASLAQIKACYDHKVMCRYSPDVLVHMIVMDTCFILEFINKIPEYDHTSYRGNMLPEQAIIYDLMLLENQVPLFILDQIFQCTILTFKPNISLIAFIRPLLNLLNIFKEDINTDHVSIGTDDHILSLLYKCYKPPSDIDSTIIPSTIQSAADLDSAGVNLKPNPNPNWMMGMDVKLNKFPCLSWCLGKSTLGMPVLYVHDFSELVLRNLIAYEVHSCQTRKYITSYTYTMDMLVSTQEDVFKLVESKVLVNFMGSNKKAANMINNLCKEVAREHFFYGKEWKKLNIYCDSYWPKNIAWLKRTYFNSPWNIIALIAGVILFALTVVQTIFTVIPLTLSEATTSFSL